jgi:hypothetical protein
VRDGSEGNQAAGVERGGAAAATAAAAAAAAGRRGGGRLHCVIAFSFGVVLHYTRQGVRLPGARPEACVRSRAACGRSPPGVKRPSRLGARLCQEAQPLAVLLGQAHHCLHLLVVHADLLAEVLDDCVLRKGREERLSGGRDSQICATATRRAMCSSRMPPRCLEHPGLSIQNPTGPAL